MWAEEVEPWLTPSEATSTFGRERAFFLWPKFGNMGLKWVHVVGYGIIWGPKKTKPLPTHVTTQNNLQKNINTPKASQSICIRQAKMYVEVFFAILRLQHECLAKLVPHVVFVNHTDACSGNGCFAKLLHIFALDQKPLTHLLSFTQLLPSPATIAELNEKVMFWLCGIPKQDWFKSCCFVCCNAA